MPDNSNYQYKRRRQNRAKRISHPQHKPQHKLRIKDRHQNTKHQHNIQDIIQIRLVVISERDGNGQTHRQPQQE